MVQRTFAAGDDAFAAFELDAYTDVSSLAASACPCAEPIRSDRCSRSCGQQRERAFDCDQVHCSISHSAELGVKTVRDASGKPAHNGKEVRS